jgi:hypothetical protein
MIDQKTCDEYSVSNLLMTSEDAQPKPSPVYARSPWLPRGQVRKCIFLLLLVIGLYGCTFYLYYIVFIVIVALIFSPRLLLTTAHYYGKAALFLGQFLGRYLK